jgi:hypothetical protein
VLARLCITRLLDAAAELALLCGAEERNLVDLDQVGLEAAFGRDGGLLIGRGVEGAEMAGRIGLPQRRS